MTTPSLVAITWPRAARLPAALRAAFRQEAILVGIVSAFVVLVSCLGLALGKPGVVGFFAYMQRAFAVIIVVAFAMIAIQRMRDMKAGVPASLEAYKSALTVTVRERFNINALTAFMVTLVPLILLKATFSAYKQMFYLINPYTWDAPLAAFDRALHAGHDPWTLVDPLLHAPWASILMDRMYFGGWAVTLLAVVVWQSWQPPSRKRSQFVYTYVAAWLVIGVVLATILASGGPTYYTAFTGEPSFFAGHKAYLRSLAQPEGLSAINIQDGLWASYKLGESLPAAGISAMPSMHVAMAELYAILGRRTSRMWGIAGTLFSLTILVGSVYLGPHYAIDGYASIILVHILWRAVGWLMERRSAKTAS
jgi:hypothetical protein